MMLIRSTNSIKKISSPGVRLPINSSVVKVAAAHALASSVDRLAYANPSLYVHPDRRLRGWPAADNHAQSRLTQRSLAPQDGAGIQRAYQLTTKILQHILHW